MHCKKTRPSRICTVAGSMDRAFRHFSALALAFILVAIVPINGPLTQRASHIRPGYFELDTDVRINIAQKIPEGYVSFNFVPSS